MLKNLGAGGGAFRMGTYFRKQYMESLFIRGKVSLVLGRDNLMELYASSLPSAPPRNILVELLEYSSETDDSDRLSTILKVASG